MTIKKPTAQRIKGTDLFVHSEEDKPIGHGIFNSKGCFWCHTKHHNGLNCPDRPKTVVDAFMRGKQAGRDEANVKWDKHTKHYCDDYLHVVELRKTLNSQKEKIAALETEIKTKNDTIDELIKPCNKYVKENARLRDSLKRACGIIMDEYPEEDFRYCFAKKALK